MTGILKNRFVIGLLVFAAILATWAVPRAYGANGQIGDIVVLLAVSGASTFVILNALGARYRGPIDAAESFEEHTRRVLAREILLFFGLALGGIVLTRLASVGPNVSSFFSVAGLLYGIRLVVWAFGFKKSGPASE